MPTQVLPPYPSGQNWFDWATQIVDYLSHAEQITDEVTPQIVQLAYKDDDSRATFSPNGRGGNEGTIMYDPALDAVVVSIEGEWSPIPSLQTSDGRYRDAAVYPLGDDAYMSVGQYYGNDGRYGGMRVYDANGDKTGSGITLDAVNPASTYIDCGLDGAINFRTYDAANEGPYSTVATIYDGMFQVDTVRCRTNQQLILAAGEATRAPEIATMTSEALYIAAEAGLHIYSSTDNLTSGLNNYAYINNTSGRSMFPNSVGIGVASSPNTMLHVKGATVASSSITIAAYDGDGNDTFYVRDDGYIRMAPTYDKTTSAVANFNIDSVGWLRRSTSSGKYKDNYRELTDIYASLDLLNPIRFYSLTDKRDYIGFEAENVGQALPEAYYDDNYDVRSVAALNTAILKDMDARLRKLENA